MSFVRRKPDYVPETQDSDIVICVMGPTKAGKSSFLNQLLPRDVEQFAVGKRLASCTGEVSSRTLLSAPSEYQELNEVLSGRRVVLMDTPGFDMTYLADDEVLLGISAWLTDSYNKGMLVGGVIYIHDITRVGTATKAFTIFSKLCGDNSMHLAGIVTTKWDRLCTPQEGVEAENELSGSPWGHAMEAGARLFPLQPSGRTEPFSRRHMVPWDIIHELVFAAGLIADLAQVDPPGLLTRAKLWFHSRSLLRLTFPQRDSFHT